MRKLVALAIGASLTLGGFAQAQGLNPRSSLRSIITAFQRCGPPQAYQALSPQLFSIVAQQTGGSGCYVAIYQAGPISRLKVMQSQQFPIGPLYVVRVTHQSGVEADWFIGFNNATGKIEYLSFQPVVGDDEATIEDGPAADAAVIADDTPQSEAASPRCVRFPRMCPKAPS